MKKLYIHVGLAKTGTTAIQEFSYLNREKLKYNGIFYPEETFGLIEHAHHQLALDLERCIEGRDLQIICCDFLDRNNDQDCDLFLSSEYFFTVYLNKPLMFIDFIKLMQKLFDVYILITIRRDDLMLQSLYLQEIKGMKMKFSFEQWIDLRIPTIGTVYFFIEALSSLLPGKIFIIPYVEGDDVIARFFKCLLINVDGLRKPQWADSARFGYKHCSALYWLGLEGLGFMASSEDILALSCDIKSAFAFDEFNYQIISSGISAKILNYCEVYYKVIAKIHHIHYPMFDMNPLVSVERRLAPEVLNALEREYIVQSVKKILPAWG